MPATTAIVQKPAEFSKPRRSESQMLHKLKSHSAPIMA
ncbi:Uncharacterized protein dnm_029090 [Desulfonema magnum]|uniref:Uncharacterized protein n=1 Tax=Desulfonema magnum TaxID=45655 RepID=A0A975BJK9_9BACT|nr:Uncharacterized protein dnm_029090 [Desulfonema magnum]